LTELGFLFVPPYTESFFAVVVNREIVELSRSQWWYVCVC